jgi:hypothetical protein
MDNELPSLRSLDLLYLVEPGGIHAAAAAPANNTNYDPVVLAPILGAGPSGTDNSSVLQGSHHPGQIGEEGGGGVQVVGEGIITGNEGQHGHLDGPLLDGNYRWEHELAKTMIETWYHLDDTGTAQAKQWTNQVAYWVRLDKVRRYRIVMKFSH